MALYHFLRQQGKQAAIFNSTETPEQYRFLLGNREIQLFDPARHSAVVARSDACFVLDIGDFSRLRDLGTALREQRIPTVCIDHHPRSGAAFDYEIIDVEASATGEIIYNLILHCGGEVDFNIAEALYAAILTDTGSFRYSNTSVRAHRVVADLLSKGVQPEEMYREVYEQVSPARVALLGMVLCSLNYESDGRFAWFAVTQEMLADVGANERDLEGITDYVRGIRGVEIAMMLVETRSKKTKVSLRSRKGKSIDQIARNYGGGGHPHAAGATVHEDYQSVAPSIVAEVKALLKSEQGA